MCKCQNTEFLLVHIQSKCGKIQPRKNSVFGHFSRSGMHPNGIILIDFDNVKICYQNSEYSRRNLLRKMELFELRILESRNLSFKAHNFDFLMILFFCSTNRFSFNLHIILTETSIFSAYYFLLFWQYWNLKRIKVL